MFTLCMSRQGSSSPDVQPSTAAIKEVNHGYLLRYKKGLIVKNWSEDWFVLYENSLLVWYADKSMLRPKGRILISEAPELLAVGEWTIQVPKKPSFPPGCHVGQLIAIGSRDAPRHVCWLIAQSPAEATDWMTAISNTLPPPPNLFIQKKRVKLTSSPTSNTLKASQCQQPNGTIQPSSSQLKREQQQQQQQYDADHTVLSGVAIDWGHGWGWGQSVWAAHSACATDAALTSTLYCPPAADYGVGGFEECDWNFGDFAF